MHFVGEILAGFLGLYLAFTQSVANFIYAVLPTEEPFVTETTVAPSIEVSEEDVDEAATLSKLPSKYEYGGPIPDILRENATFQGAAAISALDQTRNEATASSALDALVNIFCTYTTDTYTRTTTGTGFVVDSRGVILTNAHVAQFLLLEDMHNTGTTECVVRTGSPAEAKYRAELLYISPQWIFAHASLIDALEPEGTGERDYALLYIREGLENRPLPARFPALPLSLGSLTVRNEGDRVTALGYPAEGIESEALTPQTATATIQEIFTFGENRPDVVALTSSSLGARGASGGPVLVEGASSSKVLGLIVTKGDEEHEGEGSLRALTLSYVDRTITEDTGFSLYDNMAGDLALRARIFRETITPRLASWLERELQ